MAKNYFKSYIWLLETLQTRGRLTLKEIKDLWMRSSINDEEKELANRTFSNHIAAIADIFGIEIKCDRRDNTYFIENREELGGSGIREWMMEALSLNGLINESASLRSRLIFESEPSSHRFLTDIIRAMRDEKMIEVNYQSFNMESPRDFLLEPFCLKEYKRRWYLFARDHKAKYKEPHSFSLDRINTLTISDKPFKIPKRFYAESFFSTRYGVLHYENEEPALIKIKVSARQANYFRTLPLHHSQQELETFKTTDTIKPTETSKGYSIFTYYLTPNYDFIHDLLYFGEDVEVLEPMDLRSTISKSLNNLNIKYNGNNCKR